MAIKVKKSDVLWGYIGTFLNNGINILILPFILILLPTNELGLWYTFAALGGLAALLDFGFTTTLTRNITYSWSGAKSIQKNGLVSESGNGPNLTLFLKVFSVSKAIYLITSVLVLIVLLTLGTIYIYDIAGNKVKQEDFLLPWIIYVIAITTNIYFAYWSPVLKGIGAIKQDYQATTLGKVVQFVVCIVGLLLGFKLLAIALSYLIANIVKRLIARQMFLKHQEIQLYKQQLKSHKISVKEKINTFKSIWPNAYKQGIMSISKFITDKFSVLLVTSFLGLEMAAVYGLSMQIFGLLGTVATVLYSTFLPYFSQLRIKNDRKTAYTYFTLAVGVQTSIVLIGGLAILIFANPLLNLIGSNSNFLSIYPSIFLLIFFIIHLNQNLFVSFIITSNKMPMYRPYYLSAILLVVMQFLTVFYFNEFGIWSILIPMILVECIYNAWRWPLYVMKEFNVSFTQFYKDAVRGVTNKVMKKGDLLW